MKDNAKTQQAVVLAYLKRAPLTTLQARQELMVMSIASTILKLKNRGHKIVTKRVPAPSGSRKIAQYSLLDEAQS